MCVYIYIYIYIRYIPGTLIINLTLQVKLRVLCPSLHSGRADFELRFV